jgi:hypothetical protein
MKVYFVKKEGGLCPINESDRENFARIKNGSVFMKNFKKVRHPEFHRLVFNLLNEVFQFQDKFTDFERFRERIKLMIGDVREDILSEKDGVITIGLSYLSWEWGKMDDLEFKARFEKIKAACARFAKNNEQYEIINQYD